MGSIGSWCLVIFGIFSLLRGQRLRPQGFCWWFTTWWWIWFPGRCYWKILRALEAMTVCDESRKHRGVKQSNWKKASQLVMNFLINQERSKANAGFVSWVTKNDMTIWDCASNTKQRPGSCCCMSWVLPRAVNSLLWFHPSKSFLVKWHLDGNLQRNMPLEDWGQQIVYIWIKWLNRLYTLLHCTGAFKQPLILWKSEVCHPEGSTKGWDLALDGGDCCLTCSICSWKGHCHDSLEAPREKDVGWVASLGKAGQTMEAPFSSIYSNYCTVPSKMDPLIGWVSDRTLLDLTLGVLPSARRGCPTPCHVRLETDPCEHLS